MTVVGLETREVGGRTDDNQVLGLVELKVKETRTFRDDVIYYFIFSHRILFKWG